MVSTRKSLVEGWSITGFASCVILAAAGAIAFALGGSDGARAAIRFTARCSLVLFLLTFTAAACFRLWPNRLNRWIRRNRRYLGVSFACSQFVHALAIGLYIHVDPARFHASQSALGYALNGIGYAFIVAMAATSFDRSAALVGRTCWRWIHTAGAYYLWFDFSRIYFSRTATHVFYLPFAAILVAAMTLRLGELFQRRRLASTAVAAADNAT